MNCEASAHEEAESAGQSLSAARPPVADLALLNAIHLWAMASTDAASSCRADLLRAKRQAVAAFFAHADKPVDEIKPADVARWRAALEAKNFRPATVYARISRLSSFYDWVMRDPSLGRFIESNPARAALPKCPRAYQTESTKSLDDEQMSRLVGVLREKAQGADVVGKRDYALLLFFIATGMRRREVIELRGSDVELKEDRLIVRGRVKGGDYVGREVADPLVRATLLDYLEACGRADVVGSARPLWTRHDPAGPSGAPLTSHSFAKNLKRYARLAGIKSIHIHQTRHTFARIVAEETGSLVETQEALGHRSVATTRVYVRRVAVLRDKHGSRVLARVGASHGEG